MSGDYFDAMTRKIEALNEADSMYAELLREDRERYRAGRWCLFSTTCSDGTNANWVSPERLGSPMWFCVASGSLEAIEAARRLLFT